MVPYRFRMCGNPTIRQFALCDRLRTWHPWSSSNEGVEMSITKDGLMRAARVKAGHLKFRAHQALATYAVPVYRRIRSIDTPLTERYLFVLAHPRSGSTVVSHVLQSHLEIIGFGEHHEGYESMADLEALATRNAFFDRSPNNTSHYTMDKIVWNHHGLSDAIVDNPDARFIFLAREPAATLESYRRMFADMTTDERRLQSYETRLNGMIELAERIGDTSRMRFLTYDDLTKRTEPTLAELTNFLELETPLSQEYEVTSKSGSQSWGDPSAHIKAGKIISVDHDPSVIDVDVLGRANTVYRESCERLTDLTTVVPTPVTVPESR